MHKCNCTAAQVQKYSSRIGGPLMDRISIRLDVERLPTSSVLSSGGGTDSATLKVGVLKAREYEAWRISRSGDAPANKLNGSPSAVIASCKLDDGANEYVSQMAESGALSGRGLLNTLKVSRTIADMEESARVTEDHLAEAFSMRIDLGR